MSQPASGAVVRYRGTKQVFDADIFQAYGVNVVVSKQRPLVLRDGGATHHMTDFPQSIFWDEHRGVFVVPAEQVRELKIQPKEKFQHEQKLK